MTEIIQVKTEEALNECLHIRKEVFVKEQHVALDLEIDEYDQLGQAHHILLQQGGESVGTGRLISYKDASTAKLQRIAILQSWRGSGKGKVLLVGLEELAKDLGYTAAILDAQCQARTFYEKLGYVAVSEEVFLDANIEHIRMQKSLV
ncbi:GNAT family N-acetyltransferase [Longirhabdus pacifica]|uniref:GNAT family N-acetyltransferase n=1 Tax=Longirhabdus pacifica TaxID=2305227 RepID=UPI001008C17B